MVSQQQQVERKVENFYDVHVKLTAGKMKDEDELSSMGITTLSHEKIIFFCIVSSDDIPNIHYGLSVHEGPSLIAFVKNQSASLKSL